MITRSQSNPSRMPKKYFQEEKEEPLTTLLNLPVRPRGRPRKDKIFDDGLPLHLSRQERNVILRSESYKRTRLRKKQELEQGRIRISNLEQENQELKKQIDELIATIRQYQHMLCPFCPRDKQALFLSQLELQRKN